MLAWLGFAHCFLYIALRITSDWNMGHSCYIEKGRNCVCAQHCTKRSIYAQVNLHWTQSLVTQAGPQVHAYWSSSLYLCFWMLVCCKIFYLTWMADGMSRSNVYAASGCLDSLPFPLHDVYIEIWIFGRGCWQCVHSQMRNMRRCLMMCWKEWEMSTRLNIQQAKSKRTAIPAK